MCLGLLAGGCMQSTLAPVAETELKPRDKKLLANAPYSQASIPEAYGGFGDRSAVTTVLAVEEMAFGDLAGALAVLTPSLFAIPILLAGSEEQKKTYLPKVIEGEWSPYAAALIEYAFDFDPNALKTTAILQGEDYVLNGEKAFVNFQGTDYAVTDQVFEQFKAGYEQAQKQSADKNQQSLATLGIDPRRWLTDAKNAGEAKVGDTDTIKITGGVDVNKLLDDVNTALDKARNLGVEGSDSLPEKLTDAQKQQAADAIKDLSVEIYTGKDDTTLRRMLVNMGVDAEDGGE